MSCCGHGAGGPGYYGCCTCGCMPQGFSRCFISTQEKMEHLEQYKEQLEKELAGLKKHIQELASCGE